MARTSATLATELQSRVVNVTTEAEAVVSWADAFDAYMAGATGLGISIVIAPAFKAAMETALAGMSSGTQGATKIAAGVSAYWGLVIAGYVLAFPAAIAATLPTGLGDLAANLQITFTANKTGGLTLSESLLATAETIHDACTGGTLTIPGTPPANTGPIA